LKKVKAKNNKSKNNNLRIIKIIEIKKDLYKFDIDEAE